MCDCSKIVSEPRTAKTSTQECITSQTSQAYHVPFYRLTSPDRKRINTAPSLSSCPSAVVARTKLRSLTSDPINLKRRRSGEEIEDYKTDDVDVCDPMSSPNEKCRRLASYFEVGDHLPTTQILGQLLSDEDDLKRHENKIPTHTGTSLLCLELIF